MLGKIENSSHANFKVVTNKKNKNKEKRNYIYVIQSKQKGLLREKLIRK